LVSSPLSSSCLLLPPFCRRVNAGLFCSGSMFNLLSQGPSIVFKKSKIPAFPPSLTVPFRMQKLATVPECLLFSFFIFCFSSFPYILPCRPLGVSRASLPSFKCSRRLANTSLRESFVRHPARLFSFFLGHLEGKGNFLTISSSASR